ncbi:MAG: nucleotide exchange factor GrpE [bacterium]
MDEEIKKEEEVVIEETELDRCSKEREEYLDGWRRAKADLINFKKEEAGRLAGFLKNGNENIIKDLITVLDSFELGIAATTEVNPEVMKGMILIKNQLEDALRRHGTEKLEVKKGEMFDPARHEAIGEMHSEYPDGSVVEEVEGGYLLYNKVIRASKVRLSKGEINN